MYIPQTPGTHTFLFPKHPYYSRLGLTIKNDTFIGMVSALDDGVGEVVDALINNGMYDNSIILFTTDNGGPANGFDGNAASNFPLRYDMISMCVFYKLQYLFINYYLL